MGPLSDGVLAGHIVTCPWHNARFDVRDGRMLAAPALNDLPSYEVKVEEGQVYVRQASKGTIQMPEGEDGRSFLIVGAGAAGNAAAEMLRRGGFCGRIVLVTAESVGPYDRTMLSKDFLSGEAPAKWLPLRGEKFYSRLKIELLTGRRVVGLDAKSKTVRFEDGGSSWPPAGCPASSRCRGRTWKASSCCAAGPIRRLWSPPPKRRAAGAKP
jgi:hypothetical protein